MKNDLPSRLVLNMELVPPTSKKKMTKYLYVWAARKKTTEQLSHGVALRDKGVDFETGIMRFSYMGLN